MIRARKFILNEATVLTVFGYLNPRTNKIEGFDVDIVKEIARAIFGDPEKVDLKGMPSAARIPSLMEGTVDIVVSTMTITKARMEQIDFADVYYESGQMILVPGSSEITGIQDTAGKRVCAANDFTDFLRNFCLTSSVRKSGKRLD